MFKNDGSSSKLSLKAAKEDDVEKNMNNSPSPEQKQRSSGLFQTLTFSWLTPIFLLAKKKELDVEDLYALQIHETSQALKAAWGDVKTTEVIQGIKNVSSKEMWIAGAVKFLNTGVQLATPVLMNYLLLSVQTLENETNAYLFAFGFALTMFMKAFTENAYFWLSAQAGWKARSAISSAVFSKSMRVRNVESIGTGKIVNMMQVDAAKIELFMFQAWSIVDAPIQLVAYTGLLYHYVGWSSLVGLLLFIVAIPIQGIVMGKLGKNARLVSGLRDKRVKTVNEALQAILGVKLSAWEDQFISKINGIREQEQNYMRNSVWLRAFSMSFFMTLPTLAAVVVISIYSVYQVNGNVTATTMFTAISIIGQLRFPLMILPMVLSQQVDFKIGVKRLNEFLSREEFEDSRILIEPATTTAVNFSNVEAYWADPNEFQTLNVPMKKEKNKKEKKQYPSFSSRLFSSKRGLNNQASSLKLVSSDTATTNDNSASIQQKNLPVLSNVSFKIEKSDLVALVGPVASGKTSLLNAIVGEMFVKQGNIEVSSRISAFVGEDPWLKSTSIRDNILFGLAYDEALYSKIVSACQLDKDLAVLPNQDETMVGERGVVLSGGQRARVAIARAVYSALSMKPDNIIIVWDTVLKALDPEVAASLFKTVVLDMLKGYTRILAVSQLHLLDQFDKIILLGDGGTIVEFGSFSDLKDKSGPFSELMARFSNQVNRSQTPPQGHAAVVAVSEVSVDATKITTSTTMNDKPSASVSAIRPNNNNNNSAPSSSFVKEERASGAVRWELYNLYIVSGTIYLFVLVILLLILAQAATTLNSFWISYWSIDASQQYANETQVFWIVGYFLTALLVAVLAFFRTAAGTMHGVNAATNLHKKLVQSVLYAPMSFHNTTPVGRIVARVSSDVNEMDDQLSQSLSFFLFSLVFLVFALGTMIFVTPWIALAIPFVFVIYYWIFSVYRRVLRDGKRIEALVRSPIVSDFSEALVGMASLRSYHLQNQILMKHEYHADRFVQISTIVKGAERWLNVRLECLGSALGSIAAFLIVSSSFSLNLDPSFAGLSLSFVTLVSTMMGGVVRSGSNLEAGMNSVARVNHYSSKIDQEKIIASAPDKAVDVPSNWPLSGEIKIQNLRVRYRENTPEILHGISLHVKPGKKVGVVGRSGSGKSTLFLALLRIIEPLEGSLIEVDQLNIQQIDLPLLRRRVGSVPQSPVVFAGTIRTNLSPFGEYRDDEMFDALERAGLKGRFESLDFEITENGSNISAGEKQLLCIARSILRKATILLLDEHASSLDFDSAALVNKSLEQNFQNSTILSIAHNLSTVISSDEIIVMGDGNILEQGSPKDLLMNPKSEFYSMCDEQQSVDLFKSKLGLF